MFIPIKYRGSKGERMTAENAPLVVHAEENQPLRVVLSVSDIPAGVSIAVEYSVDGSTNWLPCKNGVDGSNMVVTANRHIPFKASKGFIRLNTNSTNVSGVKAVLV